MPKRGPAHPVTQEWKDAVVLRLQNSRRSYTWLAEKVGVTRAAITHLMTKSVQSSLVPLIEEALELTKDGRSFMQRVEADAPGLLGPEHEELTREVATTIDHLFGPADQREVIATFAALKKPEHRQRVLGLVRTLWELERHERLAEADREKVDAAPEDKGGRRKRS